MIIVHFPLPISLLSVNRFTVRDACSARGNAESHYNYRCVSPQPTLIAGRTRHLYHVSCSIDLDTSWYTRRSFFLDRNEFDKDWLPEMGSWFSKISTRLLNECKRSRKGNGISYKISYFSECWKFFGPNNSITISIETSICQNKGNESAAKGYSSWMDEWNGRGGERGGLVKISWLLCAWQHTLYGELGSRF